jgi:hypothetical protein
MQNPMGVPDSAATQWTAAFAAIYQQIRVPFSNVSGLKVL